jgi:hypothetical protein
VCLSYPIFRFSTVARGDHETKMAPAAPKEAITKASIESRAGLRFWARFWAQADEVRACWLWRGPVDRAGRGLMPLSMGPVSAHVAAWVYDGRLAPTRPLVAGCGNRRCIRPEHQQVRR